MGYWEQIAEDNRRHPPADRVRRIVVGVAIAAASAALWWVALAPFVRG
jgi:hypothetical protein